jgi:hypothetical protein
MVRAWMLNSGAIPQAPDSGGSMRLVPVCDPDRVAQQ